MFFSQNLDFNTLPENKVVNLTYWGNNPKAEIKYKGKNLFVSGKNIAFEQVYLQFNKKVKTISFNIQTNPASYNNQYVQEHTGKVSVETPEVYELSNIILTLSDKFHQSNYKMRAIGDYYADVLTWFSPFKDHEIFMKLDDVDYYSLVENAAAYVFNADKIEQSSLYKGFRAIDEVKENISVLEDFAKKSDFKTFYKQHQGYYSRLSNVFQAGAKPKSIWRWLESHFPARYHSYKVFFSPLGAGNNSSRMFAHNDFNESIMFISAPNRYENDDVSIQALKFTRSFFTEIDHTYVNPISDKYIDDINTAFPDLKSWYKGGGYNKPYLTFNEYMTWSLVSLYAMDNYTTQEYQFIKNYTEDFMVNKRGFYRFKAFNNELIRLYKNKSTEEKITDLYPAIIRRIRKNTKNTKRKMHG
ncbi:DUF4932 domain-containing protein [Colwellia sp. MSW7]|uniref:DUF4932 domain-containing protein n=1 Tax=Colwellia maritima TaxID=2912588 RepID=A0ABS9WWZ8_9GAMM|nr:DUF4932 domain-containing protein [Colwellia maritima]